MTKAKESGTLFERQRAAEVPSVCLLMPKIPSESNGRLALRHRVNQLLAERGANVRVSEARGAAQRQMLGDYFLVGYPDRHVIARDNVDLYQFAREIGALAGGAC